MKHYCLLLDLQDDPALIAAYDEYHQRVWPEIKASIRESGILDMTIYRAANRLVMIIETEDDFSFERKAKLDASNPRVQEWEQLMSTFQKRLPFAAEGQKWVKADEVFHLIS
ncbi:MAG: L-rhamnose mutarotase [Cyclobacteriaceae bacterium]|nr:L-rhamnose mutarotase [Cyclobacteriaceae bacterium]